MRLEGSLPGKCRAVGLEEKEQKNRAILKQENPGRGDNDLAQAWVIG